MAIEFGCPYCGNSLTFDEEYKGQRACCRKCAKTCVIPDKSGQLGEKLEDVFAEEPRPGFFDAAFKKSWRIFVKKDSLVGIVFVIFCVCLKFFVGDEHPSFAMPGFAINMPIGLIITIVTWGCLLWYYLQIIEWSSMSLNVLPEVDFGGFFSFIWQMVKTFYIYFAATLIALLPCIISQLVLRDRAGWQDLVSFVLMIAGIYFLPILILAYAIQKDLFILLRLDLLFKIIKKVPLQYSLAAAGFTAAWLIQMKLPWYAHLRGQSIAVISFWLAAHLAVQVLAVIVMRMLGLLYRHYFCYIKF